MTSTIVAIMGSKIASILLIDIPKASPVIPGDTGNGSSILGGDC